MKIGILTFHYSNNYGAILQTYALSKTLSKLGFEPVILNRVPDDKVEGNFLFIIRRLINGIFQKFFQKEFYQFRKEYLQNITELLTNEEDLKSVVKEFDAVIVGSDQVWRMEYTKGLGLNNFLDFVPYGIKKIAYAASFGKDSFDGNLETTKKVELLLSQFNAVSVREDRGVVICKDSFNVVAKHLIDPVLLLSALEYGKIIKEEKSKSKAKFIAHYILDPAVKKSEMINKIAKLNNINTCNIYRESDENFSIKKFDFSIKKYRYPSFSSWLKGLKDAEFVITDSYHGAVFSILFNKQFICIANKKRGVSRLASLLKKFQIEDRLVWETDSFCFDIKKNQINYKAVNQILDNERFKSIKFIKDAL